MHSRLKPILTKIIKFSDLWRSRELFVIMILRKFHKREKFFINFRYIEILHVSFLPYEIYPARVFN